MNKKIILIAKNKFKKIIQNYCYFNVIFLDNWRGWRFIYDTPEIKKYPGDKFYKSELYKILKNEKSGYFSAGLYLASASDRKLYGPNPFLNCKTYFQYRDCYVNFLLKKTRTKKEILAELKLIKKMKIIYAKRGNKKLLERQFRRNVVSGVLVRSSKFKKLIIREYVEKNYKFFCD